ncbi:GNAT family N-acetyltransferase [Oceanirhabdus seepicola]|uniref:GNAT family N-acetyltransferase n=1 Tax=Oceanirhabdus seepicola TaxID=2828781 RepID=A0A9J6P5V2_9CLOT|nr:GNAT family N-acetyltransferase [Oceanirhabdus seepicola]MCM1992194.1 GNAT family N-acetyltransferase [Oceanirhabdus seepicola]
MEITFQNATVNDINILFELNKKLIEKYEINLNLDFEKIFTWVKRKIENNIELYQCIYFDGIKAGYYYLHNDGEKLELDDFFIFDEFQGRGIGTKVIKYIASISKEKNKEVFLYVFANNQGAFNLYLRNGYKIVENIADSRYIMSTQASSCTH